MSDSPVKPAFIALADEAEIRANTPPGAKANYDFGFVPNMRRLLLAHPRLGMPFQRLLLEVLFKPGELTRAEKEMVAAVAAAAQDCAY